MSRRHLIAVGVALASMVIALAQPLWIRSTGDEVALSLRPVDPLSFFRGDYVDLAYVVDIPAPLEAEPGDVAYVVFDDARPAHAVRTTIGRPELMEGETCLRGKVSFDRGISFPAIEQFFVTSEEGSRLERELSSMVGIVRAVGSCRAVLVGIEPL